MKEHPILFSAPMVRALLSGGKTQTRRILKCDTPIARVGSASDWSKHKAHPDMGTPSLVLIGEDGRPFSLRCPYGKPGERLWVRETWQGPLLEQFESDADDGWMGSERIHQYQNPAHCQYAADGGKAPEFIDSDDNLRCRWRPSIHMPRWASRILLELVDVRVERLQEISYEDSIAEGIADPASIPEFPAAIERGETVVEYCRRKAWPQRQYRDLWESINGAGSWDANPWVWVVSFRRVAP